MPRHQIALVGWDLMSIRCCCRALSPVQLCASSQEGCSATVPKAVLVLLRQKKGQAAALKESRP